jgi:hypothetical protein
MLGSIPEVLWNMLSEVPIMKPMPQIFALHYIFAPKPGRVVAHCLDLDLVVEGKDEKTAEERLNTVVRAAFGQAARAGSLALAYFPAPPHFWGELKRAKALPTATLVIETPPMVLQVEQAVISEMPVLRAELETAA